MSSTLTSLRPILVGACALLLAGCGIPPVDTSTVSRAPADAASFAVAQRAVQACGRIPDFDAVVPALRRAGFQVTEQRVALRGGRETTRRDVRAPDSRVSVLFHGSSCYVGLEGMTPEQSSALAQAWVRAYGAQPNSAFGDGLSDHVSGAWRRFFTEPADPPRAEFQHRIYVAAYKTWPSGPYDPQRNVPFDIGDLFPDRPGAAVELTYAIECNPIVQTGANSGAFLSCDRNGGGGDGTGTITFTLR